MDQEHDMSKAILEVLAVSAAYFSLTPRAADKLHAGGDGAAAGARRHMPSERRHALAADWASTRYCGPMRRLGEPGFRQGGTASA